MSPGKRKAFILLELLVVIATIALLMAILVPALAATKAQGKKALCKSHIHQLVLANIGYASESDGSFALAALDIFSTNKHRWHGARDDINSPFDPTKGPLAAYLADGRLKKCPQKVAFRHGDPWNWNYEDGCGGYGYNMTYIGSRIWQGGYEDEKCRTTTKDSEVGRPVETLMFADTAMAQSDNGTPYYLEYSFAEPRYFVVNGKTDTTDSIFGYPPSPSIHFRHRSEANVGWADGHITSEEMAPFERENAYGVKSGDMMLGWFEPLDNSMFDLQ